MTVEKAKLIDTYADTVTVDVGQKTLEISKLDDRWIIHVYDVGAESVAIQLTKEDFLQVFQRVEKLL